MNHSAQDPGETPNDEFVYVSEPTTNWTSPREDPPPGLADGDSFRDSTGLKWTARRAAEEYDLPFDAIADLGATVAKLTAKQAEMPLDKQALLALFSLAQGLALRCAKEARDAREERDRYKNVLAKVSGSGRKVDAVAKGNVYFLQSSLPDGLIKIGFSTYPPGRLRAIQTMHGHPLTLLHYERGTKRDESALHKRFAGCRAEGEWFRPARGLVDYIKSRKTTEAKAPTTEN